MQRAVPDAIHQHTPEYSGVLLSSSTTTSRFTHFLLRRFCVLHNTRSCNAYGRSLVYKNLNQVVHVPYYMNEYIYMHESS
jgi:hypothetical protein